ncbi:hypothetical protein JB92DRAFT_2834756 [Gautieria morchelliformis]|nr:hypothetical protein JB92DRAFT_2834756 [Gautieria morchelliformis]
MSHTFLLCPAASFASPIASKDGDAAGQSVDRAWSAISRGTGLGKYVPIDSCPQGLMCMDALGPTPNIVHMVACLDHPGSKLEPPDIRIGVYQVGEGTFLNPPENVILVTLAKPLTSLILKGSLIMAVADDEGLEQIMLLWAPYMAKL